MKKNLLAFVVLILSVSFSSLKTFAQNIPGGSADGYGVETNDTPGETSGTLSIPSGTSSTTFFTNFSSYFKTCHTSTCSKSTPCSTPCSHASCYRANIADLLIKGKLNFLNFLYLYSNVPKCCK